jgi:hypothetical protein
MLRIKNEVSAAGVDPSQSRKARTAMEDGAIICALRMKTKIPSAPVSA